MPIRAPFLPYEKLREEADRFLEKYHQSRSIPVPIERIIEFAFEMDIVPIPGLMDNFEVDSSISRDLTTIYVDQKTYLRFPGRYRFSIAHELAHRLIHRDVFSLLTYTSIEGWKLAMQSIPVDQYKYIELQAYGLAGLILVPGNQLQEAFELAEDEAAAAGFDIRDCNDEERKIVGSKLARQFGVSLAVMERRLRFDNRWKC